MRRFESVVCLPQSWEDVHCVPGVDKDVLVWETGFLGVNTALEGLLTLFHWLSHM